MFHPLHHVVHGKAAVRALLFPLAVWSSIAFAQSPPSGLLSLESALKLAQTRSSLLVAQDSAATASRAMAVSAGQLPDPTLKLGINNLPVTSSDRFSLSRDFMTMRRIGVMQEYVSADKRDLLRRRGELEALRQDASRHRLTANLRQEVAVAWFDRYYALRSRELLKSLEAEVEIQLRTLDSQIRAAKASVGDASMAAATLLQVQDRVLVADKQERLAQIALARCARRSDCGTRPSSSSRSLLTCAAPSCVRRR